MVLFNARAEGIKEPITLDDVKMHLRTILGDTTEEESILRPLISTAREYAEGVTGHAWAEQTIDAFPEAWGVIRLPRPPVKQVEEIAYRTEDGTEHVLDADRYAVDLIGAKIYIKDPPTDALSEGHPIRVTYKAGGDPLPHTVRQAMLLLIGHWYNNREAVVVGSAASVEVDITAKTLLNAKKEWWF